MKNLIFNCLLLTMGLLPALAQAMPRGIVYTHQIRDQIALEELFSGHRGKQKAQLVYHGGPVLSQAKLFAVMWGPNVEPTTISGIGDMLSATVNSSYWDMLKEYDTDIKALDGTAGSQQHIERGSYAGLITIKPSNTKTALTDEEVGVELEHQVDLKILPKPDANTVFVTYFPPGISISLQGSLSCEVFCGYHNNYASRSYGLFYYGVLPDLGGSCALGCGIGTSRFDSITAVSAHELVEVATDPAVSAGSASTHSDGWSTITGQEIGDLCASNETKLTLRSGKSYLLQDAFDNTTAACAKGPFQSP